MLLLSIGAFAWLFAAMFIRIKQAGHKDRKQAAEQSGTDLLGGLYVLYETLRQKKKLGSSEEDMKRLRITLHVRNDEHQLMQYFDYLGYKESDTRRAGRCFSMKAGVVGLAARTGEPHFSVRKEADTDKYHSELVRNWGYSLQEARSLTPGRKSSMAVPIKGDTGATIAVIYADSCDENFFTEDVQEAMMHASMGIGEFVRFRYGN